MAKFFIQETNIIDNTITITNEDANHIRNVLRHLVGDKIICSSENGIKYTTTIKTFEDNKVKLDIISKETDESEPKVNIDLFQGLPKSDKLELIIQKCVELGVNKIIPLVTKRTIVKLDSNSANKKLIRWQRISYEASKQCLRGKVPIIENIKNFKDLKEIFKDYDLLLVPYENEKDISLKEILLNLDKDIKNIAIFIGPEGGFEEEEVATLVSNGAKSVSLGKRILRTETAAIAVLAMLIYEFDL